MQTRCLSLTLVVVVAGSAHAGPTVDSLLCRRLDDRYDQKDRYYVSVTGTPQVSHVSATDDGTVTACKDATKDSCATFKLKSGTQYGLAINPEGSLVLAAGNADSKKTMGLFVVNAKDGSVKKRILNKRASGYDCSTGIWLGDAVLAFGGDCSEFDSMPFLASAKTGKYIAPFVGKKFTGTEETLYSATLLDGKQWAIAAYDHNDSEGAFGRGQVFVVDVTTGKVSVTVDGTAAGGATLKEGKQTRALDKLSACKP